MRNEEINSLAFQVYNQVEEILYGSAYSYKTPGFLEEESDEQQLFLREGGAVIDSRDHHKIFWWMFNGPAEERFDMLAMRVACYEGVMQKIFADEEWKFLTDNASLWINDPSFFMFEEAITMHGRPKEASTQYLAFSDLMGEVALKASTDIVYLAPESEDIEDWKRLSEENEE